MSRTDAERALGIYKTFSKQTDQVVQYLAVARQYEMSTRLEIPKLKHAPTSLTKSLEEYLNDPDFEVNRRQYLAQQPGGKNPGSKIPGSTPTKPKTSEASKQFAAAAPPAAKGPAPDLIDFFESIEQNQQTMAQQPGQDYNNGFQQPQQQQAPQQFFPQQTGFAPQNNPFGPQPTGFNQPQQQQGFSSTNPFGQPQNFSQNPSPFLPQQQQAQPPAQIQQPQQQQQQQQLQPQFTGAGFGGYTPQPQSHFQSSLSSIPQDGVASFQQQPGVVSPQQTSNPFRQSMLPQQTGASQFSTPASPLNRQSTNPFAKNPFNNGQPTGQSFGSNSPFSPQPNPLSPNPAFTQSSPPPAQALAPQRTGTNPFAKMASPPPPQGPTAQPLRPNPTGSTNPFRQSAFVNQETGQAWQQNSGGGGVNQGTWGGLDVSGVQTNPIFPRPGTTT